MASKGVIIGAVAVVAIIAVAGAAFMFMGDDETPSEPPAPVKDKEFVVKEGGPTVGQMNVYSFFAEAPLITVMSVPSDSSTLFYIEIDGSDAEYCSYAELRDVIDYLKASGDELFAKVMGEDMAFTKGTVSFKGTLLNNAGDLKSTSEIKAGDKLIMHLEGTMENIVTSVTDKTVTLTLGGTVTYEELNNPSADLVKIGEETIDTAWGSVKCGVYKDLTDGNLFYINGLATLKVTLEGGGIIMDRTLISSTIFDFVEVE